MKKYAFGIDVGGTTVKIGMFHISGELTDKWEIKTRTEESGRYILSDIADSIDKHIKLLNISYGEIEGIGIGVPGAVLEDGTVNRCVNLGWGIMPVKEKLSDLMKGIPVSVGNDANVAALGEMWQGGGKGYKDIVMITLGTGVGGGVILNRKIVTGAFGAAGEIGHLQMVENETENCGCGKKGCLEQYASATGIKKLAEHKLNESGIRSSLRNMPEISAKDIFDEAKKGDILALELIDTLGHMLGRALSFISCVVDPQAFVIGGGISKAGPILIETVQKYYKKAAFHASGNTEFRLAELGNDAGIYGAVKLVL